MANCLLKRKPRATRSAQRWQSSMGSSVLGSIISTALRRPWLQRSHMIRFRAGLTGIAAALMSLRPFGTIAVFGIVAGDNAERLGMVKRVIRTVASCAPLPNCLSSFAGTVAAFQRRARVHRGVADDYVVAGHDRNLRLNRVWYLPTPRYYAIGHGVNTYG